MKKKEPLIVNHKRAIQRDDGTYGISVIIVTHNEAKNLIPFFQHVRRFCDEIIVIDQSSTDNSVNLAKKYADIVIASKNIGSNEMDRRAAINFVRNEWVCTLDPDEHYDNDFVDKIHDYIHQAETEGYDGISVVIQNVYDGIEINVGSGNRIRLHKKLVPLFERVHTGPWCAKPLHIPNKLFHYKYYEDTMEKEQWRQDHFDVLGGTEIIAKKVNAYYQTVKQDIDKFQIGIDEYNIAIKKELDTVPDPDEYMLIKNAWSDKNDV